LRSQEAGSHQARPWGQELPENRGIRVLPEMYEGQEDNRHRIGDCISGYCPEHGYMTTEKKECQICGKKLM
jgi:hypothetical protein